LIKRVQHRQRLASSLLRWPSQEGLLAGNEAAAQGRRRRRFGAVSVSWPGATVSLWAIGAKTNGRGRNRSTTLDAGRIRRSARSSNDRARTGAVVASVDHSPPALLPDRGWRLSILTCGARRDKIIFPLVGWLLITLMTLAIVTGDLALLGRSAAVAWSPSSDSGYCTYLVGGPLRLGDVKLGMLLGFAAEVA
jgi:hypothetical protein